MRRDDARILARAEEIKADKKRYEAAKLGARELLEENLNRAEGLRRVVSNSQKRTSKKDTNKKQKNSTSYSDVFTNVFKR